jgi:hypothetical protein
MWRVLRNEPIYERADVKRGGADFVSRASAHPLRRRLRSIWPISDLSADELVVATRNTSSEPEAEGGLPPSRPAVYEALAERDVIRSTITWDQRLVTLSPLNRYPRNATIQAHEVSDGAAVGVRCGVVHLVVTSTGLRSTGGSLSQRLGSVHSWFAILFMVEGATDCG